MLKIITLRNISLLFLCLLFSGFAYTQNVGIGTNSPNTTAILDLSSTTKGFLPPRMDSTQLKAIVSPATGLIIYNTSIKAFQCYNGTAWYSTVHYIGESYGGGIVFYVYDNGQHGLIASPTDQSSGIQWYNGTYTTTNSVRDGINAGKYNTERIISNQGTGSYASQTCANYKGGNYGDWYLPSKYELNLLYSQKNVVGSFANDYYWSSSEDDTDTDFAWLQSFEDGTQDSFLKYYPIYNVRAIRAF